VVKSNPPAFPTPDFARPIAKTISLLRERAPIFLASQLFGKISLQTKLKRP